MKLVIASNNKNKIKEIHQILGNFFDAIFSLDDLGRQIEVEETGKTFFENALLKARTVSKQTKMAALSDDSGLVVGALGGAPGVYSARYAGIDCNQQKNNELLLKRMENIVDRQAYFVSHIVLYFPDGSYLDSEGIVNGRILYKPEGDNGFGYDSLFFCDELSKSFGVATENEKNSVSHRARALEALKSKLSEKKYIRMS